MDNSQSSELTREMLLKVLTGDNEIGYAVMHALRQQGLIRLRDNAPKRVGIDALRDDPVTDFELTAKGLARLQGE